MVVCSRLMWSSVAVPAGVGEQPAAKTAENKFTNSSSFKASAMKTNRTLLLLFSAFALHGCFFFVDLSPETDNRPTAEELDERYKAQWSAAVCDSANSATTETYLTSEEQRTFYYLNLARLRPQLFATTYADGWIGPNGYSNGKNFSDYKSTLIADLKAMHATNTLLPSRKMYDLAYCHAVGIGNQGLDTHDRSLTGCPSGYRAECISFGMHSGFEVAMQLLVDDDVPSLGHRKACLGNYTAAGVACHDHKKHGRCAVVDFE